MKTNLRHITILGLISILLASCNSYEKLTYLQDIEETKDAAKQKADEAVEEGIKDMIGGD